MNSIDRGIVMNKNINLNLYRVFYEVAKHSSISAAAKNIYLSQPAISKSIKNLETELGVILFYRTLNGIILTEKGKELFEIVEFAFNKFREAEKKMIQDKNMEFGSLSIGVRSHIASFYLMDKVVEFHKKYNKINIVIVNRPSSELLKLLENNEIDLILDFVSDKDNLDYFDVRKLETFSHCFVCSSELNYNLNVDVYKLKDLENLPLILPVSHSSPRQNLEILAMNKKVVFSNVLSIENSELIYSMVKRGLGVGYILREMVKNDIENGELREIKLTEDLPKVSLNLIYKEKVLTETSRRFIDEYLSYKL